MKLKWLPKLEVILLPLIPLIYLYNQNIQYLYLPQVILLWGILAVISWLLYEVTSRMFKSPFYGMIMSITWVVLIFNHEIICSSIFPNILYYSILLFASEPFVAYVFTYIVYKISKRFETEQLMLPFSVFFLTVLILNVSVLVTSSFNAPKYVGQTNYKDDFNIDENLPNPNIYWIFADGMLGFDAMDKYFGDPQDDFRKSLTDRGFVINSSASFEGGHATRISIPTLMSPDYYDTYLEQPLSSHEGAMRLKGGPDSSLFEARINNELIKAFDQKGYTTIAMSLDESNFMPITDLFYYVHFFGISGDMSTEPILVKKQSDDDGSFEKKTVYAKNLGELVLGELINMVSNKILRTSERIEIPLRTEFENTKSVLLESDDAKVYSSLINSIYDVLYSDVSKEPKLTIIHNLIAHSPYSYNENGALIEKKDFYDITKYPQHHTYAAKVTENIIDMILEADESAIIIVQADHGLHTLPAEYINKGLSTDDAEIEIWNSVISAIRVPNEYLTNDIEYAKFSPLNITRFLVNSFVGDNYDYIQDK